MKWIKATAIPLGVEGQAGAQVQFDFEGGDNLSIMFWNDQSEQMGLPMMLRKQAEAVEEQMLRIAMEHKKEAEKQAKEAESPIKHLVCEVCAETIGIFDVNDISMPVIGGLFKSKDPAHGLGDPFPYDVSWEHLKCPYCRRRPFIVPEGDEDVGPRKLLTEHGFVDIPPMVIEEAPTTIPSGSGIDPTAKVVIEANTASTDVTLTSNEVKLATKEDAEYVCEVCGRKFTHKIALIGHSRVHKEKP